MEELQSLLSVLIKTREDKDGGTSYDRGRWVKRRTVLCSVIYTTGTMREEFIEN